MFDFQPLRVEDLIGRFSFLYDGVESRGIMPEARVRSTADGVEAVFDFPRGLRAIQRLTGYPEYGAVYWTLELENAGDAPTGQVSRLWDADLFLGFDPARAAAPGHRPNPESARVFSMLGSNEAPNEFENRAEYLPEGKELRYASTGGRSSHGFAPFFDVNQGEKGLIVALGWTGQWNARFRCAGEAVEVRAGLEDPDFFLERGERVFVGSVLLLKYGNGQDAGHNAFRRLVREQFSIIGRPGRPAQGPLCASFWGSVPSDKLVRRIRTMAENGVDPEYFWIDAGWYGYSTGPCPNEFVGDWAVHTGSWVVNRTYHPDGLLEVRRAIGEAGRGFVLWVEPERVLRGTDTPAAHPDWFLSLPGSETLLIDYGNPEAAQGTFELLSGLIERLEVDVYRQDFNVAPLPYWRANDAPGRKGMLEIRHINGLYALWDRLLERFPHLIIDNCASGGRRIDIETLKRSIPLWRSDWQCVYDADPESAQRHMNGINWYLPWSGTGMGEVWGDTYRARSCYGSAMVHGFWFQEGSEPDPQRQDMAWIRGMYAEFARVRPYFSRDFYPLTPGARDDAAWMVCQFHDPEAEEGMILAFRRPESPSPEAEVALKALDGRYEFEFVDQGKTEAREYRPGDVFTLRAERPRESRLVFYRKVE